MVVFDEEAFKMSRRANSRVVYVFTDECLYKVTRGVFVDKEWRQRIARLRSKTK